MSAFVITPLSEFPGLVSVLKRQGEEYRRLKAAKIPLAPAWIIPASSLEAVLRLNGKQLHLRELLVVLQRPTNKASLKLKNQVRRLITHLDVEELCQSVLKLYHQRWSDGKLNLQAVLPSGETITTSPEKGDANLIQTLLVLWAKSCVINALKSTTVTQLAPSIVITHTSSPRWLGELYCRHPQVLKHSAVVIRIKANRKDSQVSEFQIDSQTLHNISSPKSNRLPQNLWTRIMTLIHPTHPRQLNSVLRQLAHIGGQLSRMTAYPVKANFVVTKSSIYLTEVSLHHSN